MSRIFLLLLPAVLLSVFRPQAHELALHGYILPDTTCIRTDSIYDFSQQPITGEVEWTYEYYGDSIMSLTCPGIRYDIRMYGDTIEMLQSEGRNWIAVDSLPIRTAGNISTGQYLRKIRRFQSEHYIEKGEFEYTPLGNCDIILAPGDTVPEVTVRRIRTRSYIYPCDKSYIEVSDSCCATTQSHLLLWGYSPGQPLLARSTSAIIYSRGKENVSEYTEIFPNDLNFTDNRKRAISRRNSMAHRNGIDRSTQPQNTSNALPDDVDTPHVEVAQGIITIDTRQGGIPVPVVISDVAGRVMHSSQASGQLSVSAADWPYGEYIVRIGEYVRKIILLP